MDRRDQLDQLFQTSPSDSNTVVVSKYSSIRGGKVLILITTTHFQSLSLWFCLLIRWRREDICLLTKLRNTQARRQSQQSKRVLALCDIVRVQRWSQLKTGTQSNVKGLENPGQPSGDRLHFPGPPGIQKSQSQKLQIRKVTVGCKKNQENASSSFGRNESQNPNVQASGDRLQSKEDDDMTNLLCLRESSSFRIWLRGLRNTSRKHVGN